MTIFKPVYWKTRQQYVLPNEISISFQQIFQNTLNCMLSNIVTLEEIIVNLC